MFYIILMLFINFGISFYNARTVGQIWCESKAIGGYLRLLAWCGAIQSAIGFTTVYSVIAVYFAYVFECFTAEEIARFYNLIYVLIIIPAISSGFIIMLNSWIHLYRERNLSSLGVAGWNTFAQFRNMYHAYHAFGPAVKSVLEMFGGSRSRRKGSTGSVVLAAIILLLGVLTTTVIIRRYAGTLEIPDSVKDRISA